MDGSDHFERNTFFCPNLSSGKLIQSLRALMAEALSRLRSRAWNNERRSIGGYGAHFLFLFTELKTFSLKASVCFGLPNSLRNPLQIHLSEFGIGDATTFETCLGVQIEKTFRVYFLT